MLYTRQLQQLFIAVIVSLHHVRPAFSLHGTAAQWLQESMHTSSPTNGHASAPLTTTAAKIPSDASGPAQTYAQHPLPTRVQNAPTVDSLNGTFRSSMLQFASDQTPLQVDYTAAPFVVGNAIVTGPSSAAEEAAFEATMASLRRPLRSLLHGRRRPARNARCPNCTIVSCSTRTGMCSGHCKGRNSAASRRLFNCSGRRGVDLALACLSVEENIYDLAVSVLEPRDSLIVTAPSPYIGCADIAGLRSGCPTPGTLGWLQPGGNSTAIQYEVQASFCASTRYLPDCTFSPVFPLGVCRCQKVAFDGRDLGTGPCAVTELALDNSPPGRGERRVDVEERDGVTHTGFADYTEPDDAPAEVYTVLLPAFLSGADDTVEVEMQFFLGVEVWAYEYDESDVYGEGGEISDDYYGDDYAGGEGTGGPETPAGPEAHESRVSGFEARLEGWRQGIARCLVRLPARFSSRRRFQVCERHQLRRELRPRNTVEE